MQNQILRNSLNPIKKCEPSFVSPKRHFNTIVQDDVECSGFPSTDVIRRRAAQRQDLSLPTLSSSETQSAPLTGTPGARRKAGRRSWACFRGTCVLAPFSQALLLPNVIKRRGRRGEVTKPFWSTRSQMSTDCPWLCFEQRPFLAC